LGDDKDWLEIVAANKELAMARSALGCKEAVNERLERIKTT